MACHCGRTQCGGQSPGCARRPPPPPRLSPTLGAPRLAQLGQEALRGLDAWDACDHVASAWEGSAGDGHSSAFVPGGLHGRGGQSILAFICSRTTEEASQNVYKRILYSSRGTPPLFTAKQK